MAVQNGKSGGGSITSPSRMERRHANAAEYWRRLLKHYRWQKDKKLERLCEIMADNEERRKDLHEAIRRGTIRKPH